MEKHFNWGLVSDSNIKLFNNSKLHSTVLGTDFLKDVDVKIDDNGVLNIKAKKILFDFYRPFNSRCLVFEEDWQRKPHPSEIFEKKRHFWSRKKEKCVSGGFVKTIETEPIEYFFNKFKIEIYD
jgi:hypothetical protein